PQATPRRVSQGGSIAPGFPCPEGCREFAAGRYQPRHVATAGTANQLYTDMIGSGIVVCLQAFDDAFGTAPGEKSIDKPVAECVHVFLRITEPLPVVAVVGQLLV